MCSSVQAWFCGICSVLEIRTGPDFPTLKLSSEALHSTYVERLHVTLVPSPVSAIAHGET